MTYECRSKVDRKGITVCAGDKTLGKPYTRMIYACMRKDKLTDESRCSDSDRKFECFRSEDSGGGSSELWNRIRDVSSLAKDPESRQSEFLLFAGCTYANVSLFLILSFLTRASTCAIDDTCFDYAIAFPLSSAGRQIR